MNASDLQLRAVDPVKFRVLGLVLQDLTLGHLELLRAHDVESIRTPADLATAVLICAFRPRTFRRLRGSWLLKPQLWLWRQFCWRWDFNVELEAFRSYMTHHTQLPEMHVPESGESGPPIPTDQQLRVSLLSRLNYRPSEIEDTPYLRAMWDWLTLEAYRPDVFLADGDVSEQPLTPEQEAAIERGVRLLQGLAVNQTTLEN